MLIRLLALLLPVFYVLSGASAAPLSGSETAGQFFEQVATTLLREELNIDLHHIPVYPTNAYSSEVHRLLQVTANLYDSTTNRGDAYPWFPSCFRPHFATNGDEVYITGYSEEAEATFIQRPWHDLTDPTDRPINPDDNVYGIPIILGTKKGFPNLNEVAVQTVADVTRKIELRKGAVNGRVTQTNQMFIVGISNTVAVELWHPWTNDYPRTLFLHSALETTAKLTNEYGTASEVKFTAVSNQWLATAEQPLTSQQFVVPLMPTFSLLSNAIFFSTPVAHFEPAVTNVFESAPAFPTNRWGIDVSSRLVLYLLDGSHLVDFVSLAELRSGFDLSTALESTFDPYRFWDTRQVRNTLYGVLQQIGVSLGNISIPDWSEYGIHQLAGADRNKAIDNFRVFVGFSPIYYPPNSSVQTNLAMQAPFTPTRRIVQVADWEVNDPLIHQLRQHFGTGGNPGLSISTLLPPSISPQLSTSRATIGHLNRRYSPWGGNPELPEAVDPFALDLSLKDPGVIGVDRWQFPEGAPLSFSSLGQIHRGTPWQTIYLKSAVAPQGNWNFWNGELSGHSTNDWQLVSILAPFLQTNAPEQLLSVNSSNIVAWSQTFTDILVTSNDQNCGFSQVRAADDPDAVAAVIEGIKRARSNSIRGYFDSLGSVLATPELTVASPWLNQWDPYCRSYYATDAALESLPAQLLAKLRPDPVAYASRQNDEVEVRFQVLAGYTYEILTSADLKTWRAISTNQPVGNVLSVTQRPDSEQGFYKLRLLQ
jgi:hypothetical protein